MLIIHRNDGNPIYYLKGTNTMTIRNNYDTSSTGTNIEFNGSYDTFLSQHNFTENFEVLQHNRYRTHTVAYYIDYGNVKGADDLSFTVKGKRKDFVELLLTECDRVYTKADLRGMKMNQLEYAVREWLEHDISLLNYEDINENQLKDTNLAIVPNKQLIMLKIRGNDQGDYAEVWYCGDDLFKAWGNMPHEPSLRKDFENYFYNAPVSVTLNVNEDEFRYDEMPESDDYYFKRDDFVKWVVEKANVPIEQIEAIVPETLEYN